MIVQTAQQLHWRLNRICCLKFRKGYFRVRATKLLYGSERLGYDIWLVELQLVFSLTALHPFYCLIPAISSTSSIINNVVSSGDSVQPPASVHTSNVHTPSTHMCMYETLVLRNRESSDSTYPTCFYGIKFCNHTISNSNAHCISNTHKHCLSRPVCVSLPFLLISSNWRGLRMRSTVIYR